MITKAIIESKIDQFSYKVRIPIFDRINDAPEHTSFNDLCIATVCSNKGINNTINVNDVVFVSFEDDTASQPIILGHLYRQDLLLDSQTSINCSNLIVKEDASLPLSTKIFDIELYTYLQKINTLEESNTALIEQIKLLQQEIDNLIKK